MKKFERPHIIKVDVNTNPSDMITINELRGFPGLENLSDKEAEDAINSLYQLSQLAIQAIDEEQNSRASTIENTKEVSG
jgi:hypothetical protein